MYLYILLAIVTLLLGLGSQAYIKRTYAKWSGVPNAAHITGAQAARAMLDRNGLHDVQILRNGQGALSDFYDPRKRTLNLSDESFDGTSVASIAVACHEAGHAVQHAKNYAGIKMREAILPLAQIGSQLWIFVLMAGFFLQILNLVWAGVILFAATVLFQIVTLPVEFDASKRAIQSIEGTVALPPEQDAGARQMLKSAAFTYVAAALSSILTLLYYVSLANSSRD
ncbi:MAG: zinc metallopeptidase [Coriobacteriia bacterium]|nr:zinc metallopeptidase [Coriobacteriia bacterium]